MVISQESLSDPLPIPVQEDLSLVSGVLGYASRLERIKQTPLLPSGSWPKLEDPNKTPQPLIPKLAMEHVQQFGNGFSVEEHKRVMWEQKEKDFQKLLELRNIINLDLSDEELEQRIGEIEQILLSTYLFQKLNDKHISVTALHIGTTPFLHTLNVLRKLRTRGLSPMAARAARWSAIWHDVGKIFGAVFPDGKYHSYLSASIGSEFLFRFCPELSEELILQTGFAIQYHHSPEGNKPSPGIEPWVSDKEMQNRMNNTEAAIALYLLIAADVTSIENYKPLYIKNLNDIFKQFSPDAYNRLQELGVLVDVPDTILEAIKERVSV